MTEQSAVLDLVPLCGRISDQEVAEALAVAIAEAVAFLDADYDFESTVTSEGKLRCLLAQGDPALPRPVRS
jgi:hypothetical protein